MRAALLYGADEFVGEWVRRRLAPDVRPFVDFTAVGVCSPASDGPHRIIAGVVWNMYYGHMISVTFAADSPRWASRRVLNELFAYPFCQLNVERITALTGRKNRKARALLVKLGFSLEGTMRKGFSRSEDGMLYGMLRSECRWLRDKGDDAQNGKAGQAGARERRRTADRQRRHAGAKPALSPAADAAAQSVVGADADAAAAPVAADEPASGSRRDGPTSPAAASVTGGARPSGDAGASPAA